MLEDRSRPWRGRHWPALLANTLLSLSATCVQATTTTPYRCESPEGVRYQHQACEGGRAVDAIDHRTKAQQRQTTQASKTAARLGNQLEAERRRLEKASRGQRPMAMDDPGKRQPKWSSNPSTRGQTLKRPRPFTVRVPKDKGISAKSS